MIILYLKAEALPWVLGKRAFISGEQMSYLRQTGKQRQYWGTGNIRKDIFDFWGTVEKVTLLIGA